MADAPNHPALSAVLLGHAPGCAVVDDMVRPRQALLRSDYSFTFVGRSVEQDFLVSGLARLREQGRTSLVWREGAGAPPLEADRVIERYEYRRREGPLDVLSLERNHEFRRMDARLMQRCQWKSEIELACGSVERFLRFCRGWCLVEGNEILSEAYAVFRGEKTYEIGVVTPAACRGRGFAPMTCARLIESCADDGMETYWSCHRSNRASNRVAAKLGFTDCREYQFLVYGS